MSLKALSFYLGVGSLSGYESVSQCKIGQVDRPKSTALKGFSL